LPSKLSPPEVLAAAVIYIGLTALAMVALAQTVIRQRGAMACREHRQAAGAIA